jgi:NAD(P)-dependent dehydrogenase (short-subunit alcohol dehydrogenase family)
MNAQRVALVTGANTGIGWSAAKRLQADGFALGFHSRKEADEDRERFEEIAAGGRAHWVIGDLAEPSVPEQLVTWTVEGLGRLDVVVNNAGVTLSKPVLELTAQDFNRIFDVDVRGAFLLAVAAAKRMREAGGGSIVNVTSVHEHVPRAGFALYAAAKAALGMVTRSLALELGPDGIRVNAVAPGAIATERNVEAGSLAPEVPLKRAGTPEEVAAAIAFLAGEASSYVTGASFVVDGGMMQRVAVKPAQ